MALPAGNYCIAAVLYGSDDKAPFINVLWYEGSTSVPPDEMHSAAMGLAIAVSNNVALAYNNVLCSESRFLGVQVRLYSQGRSADGADTSGASPGDVSGDTLPDYCAVVISKRTDLGSRSGKGRWYVGCVPESLTDTSVLTTGGKAAYQELADAFESPVTYSGNIFRPALYSAKLNQINEIKGVTLRAVLGTQRHRKFRAPF
jgi:hypothetical protein